MKNIYQSIKAEVLKVTEESSNIKTFTLKPSENFSFSTGQFIEFSLEGIGEAPFTPSSSPYITETIDITIMKTGYVTEKIHQLKSGDIVGIRGPYGKGYPIESMFDKEILILGGGVGMAPLRSFLLTLIKQIDKFKKITLCYGAKSPEDVIYKSQFEEWKKVKNLEVLRSVDKCPTSQWQESVGVVTCLLDKIKIDLKNTLSIVCGPPIMMKFGTRKLLELGFTPEQIYLSMEKNMSCGLGKCGHCQLGPHFVCKDGPVFIYEKIKNFEELWD
ncbi:MAG: oxidoreductase [Elusimicrobia bacterium RIFOXYD2_FULL_34_15]|nr:MAG: oxidoreductase [Elusimicrobia bacterium RIFOXYD2_FULL_34_15]